MVPNQTIILICLPKCHLTEAVEIIDRLRETTPDDQTCSAGVAEWDGEERADQLFGRADRSLYEAKETGRDRTGSTLSSAPRRPTTMTVVS